MDDHILQDVAAQFFKGAISTNGTEPLGVYWEVKYAARIIKNGKSIC